MAEPIREIKLPRPLVVVGGPSSVATTIAGTAPHTARPGTPVEVLAPNPLRTSRMVLRPLRADDRREFLRVVRISRDHLQKWMALHRENESDEALFDRQLEMCRAGDDRGLAWRRVGMLEDGRIGGFFNLNSISRAFTVEADANWWVSADVARIGLGTEGALAMLDHAFSESGGLGLHRVQAAIAPGNTASARLAARIGMRKTESAQVNVMIGGAWERHDLWARTCMD